VITFGPAGSKSEIWKFSPAIVFFVVTFEEDIGTADSYIFYGYWGFQPDNPYPPKP
jgi:hypothetical protein